MDSIKIKKRTSKVRNAIQNKWCERYSQFINKNPTKDWDWYGISLNSNITMEFILDNSNKPLNWACISMNPNLTMKYINNNPYKPWEWYAISMNPNITMKDINDNPDKPWYWEYISENPNITIKFINDNRDKPWNWYFISKNPFIKDKEDFQMKRHREHIAAILIQNVYKNALVNPNCQLGINRIERERERRKAV